MYTDFFLMSGRNSINMPWLQADWRDGRVAERGGLENR